MPNFLSLHDPVVWALAIAFAACSPFVGQVQADATASLKAVLAGQVQHAAQWLDERDYKSLAQSAGGLLLLGELLKAKSDDPAWQTALTEVTTKIAALQAAARTEDDTQCKSALAALQKSLALVEKASPSGKPLSAPKAPGLRPLMLTMDGIQADAKVALLSGDAASAKQQAQALAELASLVSAARSTEKWAALASDFAKACAAAATSTENDAKAVRPLFRGIAERCEACHENSRDR